VNSTAGISRIRHIGSRISCIWRISGISGISRIWRLHDAHTRLTEPAVTWRSI
jgi:hypothetical protein